MSFPWVAFVLFALLSITLLSPGSSRFPRRTHSGGKVDGATPRVSAGQVNDLSPTADFIIGSGNTGVVFRACKTACGEESTVCADGGVMVEQTVGGGGFSSADLKALGLNALTKNKFTSIDTATLQALGAYVPYSAGWSWVVVSRNTEEPACFRWEPDDESNNMGPPSFPNARTLRSKDTKFEPPVNNNGVAQLNRKNVGLLLTRRGFEAVVLLANYESRIDLSGSAELFSNLRQVAGIALAAAVDLMENHVGAEGPGGGLMRAIPPARLASKGRNYNAWAHAIEMCSLTMWTLSLKINQRSCCVCWALLRNSGSMHRYGMEKRYPSVSYPFCSQSIADSFHFFRPS